MRTPHFSDFVGKVEGGSVAPTPQGHLPASTGRRRPAGGRGERGGLAPRVDPVVALTCYRAARRRHECLTCARVLAGA